MAKFNYNQARKQKEVARKARQQEKQQRRATRPNAPGEGELTEAAAPAPQPGDPSVSGPESGA